MEATLVLGMCGVEVDNRQAVDFRVPLVAYDAAIGHDIIISYGWLAEHDVLINPRRHGHLFKGPAQEMLWVEGMEGPLQHSVITTTLAVDMASEGEEEVSGVGTQMEERVSKTGPDSTSFVEVGDEAGRCPYYVGGSGGRELLGH